MTISAVRFGRLILDDINKSIPTLSGNAKTIAERYRDAWTSHNESGSFENEIRDVITIADKNGLDVQPYATPDGLINFPLALTFKRKMDQHMVGMGKSFQR